MRALHWHAEDDVSVEHALGMGRAALASTRSATPVVVYAARPSGDARVLGAHQRAEDALRPEVRERLPILRRTTGGPTATLGAGVAYVAIALVDASTLMACPRDRVLNRNVRPILAALRSLGASAHYFGREVVSVDRRPAGLVAWTRTPRGAVLIELFLGAERSFALPDEELALVPAEPRMMGKTPITLAEALGSAPSARALAEACASACASGLGVEERAFAPEPLVDAGVSSHMRWSSAREVPIGFVRAGIATDARGVIEHAVLTGDFYQDADAPDRLQAALVGGLASPERVRDALNAVYGPHGAVIEGLRSLQPVLECFLELAAT